MRKSLREARVHSTWAIPNLAYEEATLAFVDTALLSNRSAVFLPPFCHLPDALPRWAHITVCCKR